MSGWGGAPAELGSLSQVLKSGLLVNKLRMYMFREGYRGTLVLF